MRVVILPSTKIDSCTHQSSMLRLPSPHPGLPSPSPSSISSAPCYQMADDLKGTAAEGKVSLADLVALAGSRAVSVCGGPVIPMTVGRVDATAASGDPVDRMPGETFNIEQLKASFLSKGLSIQEMVILSGETLG